MKCCHIGSVRAHAKSKAVLLHNEESVYVSAPPVCPTPDEMYSKVMVLGVEV